MKKLAVVLAAAFVLPGCGSSDQATPAASASASPTTSISDVVENVEPGIVTVVAGGSQGSGVVYKQDTVLTNQHVVGAATTVTLTLADGGTTTGRVVGTDAVADVAVIKAARTNLPPVAVRSDLPGTGETALAIGSPPGFENTVTQGVVAGIGRQVPAAHSLVDLIQTDAAISSGDSGGGLFDAKGRLLGLSEAYVPRTSGAAPLEFAIPSATVTAVADQILAGGKPTHAYLGVAIGELTDAVRNSLGVDAEKGVVVLLVTGGSPAATAGVQAGDVLTKVGDGDINGADDLYAALREYKPGAKVTVTVQRGGDAKSLSATLGQLGS